MRVSIERLAQLGALAAGIYSLTACETPNTQVEPTPTYPAEFGPLTLQPMNTETSSHPIPFSASYLVNGVRYNAYAVDIYDVAKGSNSVRRLEVINGEAVYNIKETTSSMNLDNLGQDLPNWSVIAATSDRPAVVLVIRQNMSPSSGAPAEGFPGVLVGEGPGQVTFPPRSTISIPADLPFSQAQTTFQRALDAINIYSATPAKPQGTLK